MRIMLLARLSRGKRATSRKSCSRVKKIPRSAAKRMRSTVFSGGCISISVTRSSKVNPIFRFVSSAYTGPRSSPSVFEMCVTRPPGAIWAARRVWEGRSYSRQGVCPNVHCVKRRMGAPIKARGFQTVSRRARL